MNFEEAKKIGEEHGIEPPFLLGVRRKYSPGFTQRGVFDDAIYIVDSLEFEGFKANTEPDKFGRGIALLMPGIYEYKIGTHNITKEKDKQYQALVQAGPVAIMRDQGGVERGYFGINIHRGGERTPGSEGCQTIVKSVWPKFMSAVWAVLRMRGIYKIKYLLIERMGEED